MYDTAAGKYTSHFDVKINFMMMAFSDSKILEHRFHANDEKAGSDIGYDMIIGCDLMVN